MVALFAACLLQPVMAQQKKKAAAPAYTAYLFAYFTGNDANGEQIRFALSKDGYRYHALNGNRPVIDAGISETGGVRDPHILRGADGKTFYMVATDMVSAKGWNSNRGIVLLRSADLVHWTSSVVNIQKKYTGQDSLLRVWAPQTIYDDSAKKYMVYFSMKHGKDPDRIYYAYANSGFTDLETEPKQLFFSPDNAACIDGDITAKDGSYYLFFKTEDRRPGIKIAVSRKLTHGYTMQSDRYVQQTSSPVEGAGSFRLNDGSGYVLMYDMYTSGRYQFTKTKDLQHFSVADEQVSMNFHPRHGTVMPLTTEEVKRLSAKWLLPDDIISSVRSKAIRTINTVYDTAARSIYFSVKPGTGLTHFDPFFTQYAGTTVKALSAQDFTKGPVRYAVTVGNRKQVYTVFVSERHNPALAGYYADPEVLYAQKTGRFYLYPTTDGFTGWSGTYFKAFSSPDLVNWKDEGKILELGTDVSWANKNAWAPCIVEKKIDGRYQYFYYFTAAQKIGVAVADNPTGPFKDAGRPLLDTKPAGVKGGQVIDPDVFTDPQTGRSYLYWGNGFMAGAELNEDMVSLKEGTTTLLHPGSGFREGSYVFYRAGRYYFMWSENDTRSPDYRVAYGISDAPLGKITLPQNNLILSKDTITGIYGTGHNSVIQLPGSDEWYIVYHRFNYPGGIKTGNAAGYHRELCIDRLFFHEDGTIQPVKPTHDGIKPVFIIKQKPTDR
ncbi:family 43 glycosylhydrolase [Sediminibacterium sp. WSJ-3]|nr:family 43 glycosylhydrolase [Sediminibacterium soli]